MKRKKGFTLIELMVTLSISLIVMTMIGAIFIQGYTIMNITNNKSAIQDEIRNAIMNIETQVLNSENIKIRTSDAITTYNGKDAREILYVKNETEYIVYLEVIESDRANYLVEVVLGLDNSIKSEKILLNNIKADANNRFTLQVSDTDKVININFKDVFRGNQLSGEDYILTIPKERNKDITVDLEGNTPEIPVDPSNPVAPEEPDEIIPDNGMLDVDFKISNSWDGGANYIITLTNNTSNEIIAWELIFESDVEFTSCPNGVFEKISDNKFKIKSNQNSGVIEVNKSIQIEGQCRGYIDKIKNLSIRTW